MNSKITGKFLSKIRNFENRGRTLDRYWVDTGQTLVDIK